MKLNKKMEEKGFIDQYLEVIGTNTLYGFQYSFWYSTTTLYFVLVQF